jgi:signal transduction histidine kinase/CheY-like chemotaxis protein
MSGIRSYRVLVIDGDPAVHELFKGVLTSAPQPEPGSVPAKVEGEEGAAGLADFPTFEVDSVFRGEEGLARICDSLEEGRPYTMVFADMRKSAGWDGIETLSRIWKQSFELQIVICTEHKDFSWHEIIRRFGHSGRLLILTKPFDPTEVRQVAYSLAEKWDLARQARSHLERLQRLIGERTEKLEKANLSLQRKILQNQQAERRLVTQYAVGRIVGEATSLADMLGSVLQTVGENLDWDWGAVWQWEAPAEALRLGGCWHRPDEVFEHFEAAIREQTFAAGSGLPGRTWQIGEPVWVQDLFQETGFEGATGASEAGFHCAVTLPLRTGTRLFGVMEFMCREIRERDPDQIQTLSVIGGAIGQFVERKQAEEARKVMEIQLRGAQKLESIGQLAAGIAHEINTPTQYIGDNVRFLEASFSDLKETNQQYEKLLLAVKNNVSTPELVAETEACLRRVDPGFLMAEIPRAIEQTLEGVNRVTKIVRAMKDFSHPGTEEKTPVNINKALETTLTVARNEWKYVARIETDFDPNLPLVPCLPGEFNQVLLNLVVNAAHAIGDISDGEKKDKGLITASTRRDGDWVEMRIRDTGSGIPEKIRHKIFDPFFTTKPVGKGTGQGLAMAHTAIVDRHQGTLTFETEVGVGTVFIIRLPLNPASLPKRQALARKAENHETNFIRG